MRLAKVSSLLPNCRDLLTVNVTSGPILAGHWNGISVRT